MLQVFGPTLLQDRTCISSRTCEINGIDGLGLGNGDALLLLETCAFTAAPDGHPALPSSTLSGSSFQWTDNLTEIVLSSPGGSYRLCWCMRGYACKLPEHFVVDLGAVHVIGPAPLTQHRTCFSGRSCWLDGLTQVGSADTKVLVLDTCGASTLFMPPAGHATPSMLDRSHKADVTSQVFFAAGGLYRLCWCGELVQDVNAVNATDAFGNISTQCELAENFGVDMGSLTLVGPAPLQQDRTCVAGGSCVLEGFVGTGMEVGSLLILETCGVATSADFGQPSGRPGQPPGATLGAPTSSGAAFRWEARVPAAPSGKTFRLCWCAAAQMTNWTNRSTSDNATHVNCAISSEFNMDMGTLHVVGPLIGAVEQQFTCVSGRRCSLDSFRGLDLMHEGQVLVLDTCGVQAVPTGLSDAFVLAGHRNSVLLGSETFYLPGGQYRLCWCGSQNMSNHTSYLPMDCRTDAGGLMVLAPAPLHQQRTCVSGQTCSLGITGYSLSSVDAVMALDTCGASTAVINMLAGAAELTHSGATARWDSALVTAAGGIYRLCWCAGMWTDWTDGRQANISTCETPSSFTVDFGELHLLGPYPLQQPRTCVSGLPCETAALEGLHLSPYDRFVVLDTCGERLAVVGGAGNDPNAV